MQLNKRNKIKFYSTASRAIKNSAQSGNARLERYTYKEGKI